MKVNLFILIRNANSTRWILSFKSFHEHYF